MGYSTRAHRVILLVCLLWAAPAIAQVRPGAFTTLTTTDTSADSAHIGCAVGSSTCTGGIKAGPFSGSAVTVTGALTGATLVVGGGTSIASSSNIALLSASNTFTGATQTISHASATLNVTTGAGVTTTVQPGFIGTTTATTLSFLANNATKATLDTGGLFSATGLLAGNGTAAAPSIALTNSNDTGFYRAGAQFIGITTAGVLRWGVDAAGNLTIGAAGDPFCSNGTPSRSSGFGLAAFSGVVGKDCAFTFTTNASGGANNGGVVAFGHTFLNAPTCVVNILSDPTVETAQVTATSTTTVTIQRTTTNATDKTYAVTCFGS